MTVDVIGLAQDCQLCKRHITAGTPHETVERVIAGRTVRFHRACHETAVTLAHYDQQQRAAQRVKHRIEEAVNAPKTTRRERRADERTRRAAARHTAKHPPAPAQTPPAGA